MSQSQILLFILSLSLQRVSACPPTSGIMNHRELTEKQMECSGSVHLISTRYNYNVTLNTNDYTIRTSAYNFEEPILISRAETQGCGCFVIYKLKNGFGLSRPLSQHETFIATAGFRVSSFKRIEC